MSGEKRLNSSVRFASCEEDEGGIPILERLRSSKSGKTDINTAAQAAQALVPIAGKLAGLVFTSGSSA
jgi:hypothetical protein